jgi:hypothetical protein
MKQQKLIQDYVKLSDSSLNFKAKTVVLSLTGNINFPVMTPTIADFTITQTNFSNALEKATSGDRQLIALKNQAKDELLNAMRQLAMDVDAQANGDKALLISSGFDLGSSGDSGSVLGLPSDFKISDGINAGELKFSCKRAVNAVSYILEYTDELPSPDTQWKIQPSSTRELTVRGLRSGVRIYGRMKAVGRKGQEANSDQSSRVVQ